MNPNVNESDKFKAKMVALGAIMHQVTNIMFAVLRNNTTFEFRSPEQHWLSYRQQPILMTA